MTSAFVGNGVAIMVEQVCPFGVQESMRRRHLDVVEKGQLLPNYGDNLFREQTHIPELDW